MTPTNNQINGTTQTTVVNPTDVAASSTRKTLVLKRPKPAETHAAVRSLWESTSEKLQKLENLWKEVQNSRKSELCSYGMNAATGAVCLGEGIMSWSPTMVLMGLANLGQGCVGAKGVWNDAQMKKPLGDALENIQKGLGMMEVLNEENIKNTEDIAVNIRDAQETLNGHVMRLRELENDLLKEKHNMGLDKQQMLSIQKQIVAVLKENLERNNEAEKFNTAAREKIEAGLKLLLEQNDSVEASQKNAQVATQLFLEALQDIEVTGHLQAESQASIYRVMQLQDSLFTTMCHGQDATQRVLKKTAVGLEDQRETKLKMAQEHLEDVERKNLRSLRNQFKQRLICRRAQQEGDVAKTWTKAEEFGFKSTIGGVVTAIPGGVVGTLVGGGVGGFFGAVGGYEGGRNGIHSMSKQSKVEYQKALSEMGVKKPQNHADVECKFGPSVTNWNIIALSKANKWKDSKTSGKFLVNCGGEIKAYIFDKNEKGKGSLSFEQELALSIDLTSALIDGKISAAECRAVLRALATPQTVPCERHEGAQQEETVQLIDLTTPLFADLLKDCDEIEEAFPDALLKSTIISSTELSSVDPDDGDDDWVFVEESEAEPTNIQPSSMNPLSWFSRRV